MKCQAENDSPKKLSQLFMMRWEERLKMHSSLQREMCSPEVDELKGIVHVFLRWGHIKYKSIVDLFPTIITDQCSLSLEKQRAAPAQTLSFVLQWMGSREKAKFNQLKQGSPEKINSSVRCIEKIHTCFTLPSDLPFFWHYIFSTLESPYPYTVTLMRRDTEVLWSVSEIVKFRLHQKYTPRPETGPRTVFHCSWITCCPVALMCRDTEVLHENCIDNKWDKHL